MLQRKQYALRHSFFLSAGGNSDPMARLSAAILKMKSSCHEFSFHLSHCYLEFSHYLQPTIVIICITTLQSYIYFQRLWNVILASIDVYINNVYIKIVTYETSCQSRFDARYWMLGSGALGRPRGIVWGRRRVQDGEHMYTCGGFILIFGKTNTVM